MTTEQQITEKLSKVLSICSNLKKHVSVIFDDNVIIEQAVAHINKCVDEISKQNISRTKAFETPKTLTPTDFYGQAHEVIFILSICDSLRRSSKSINKNISITTCVVELYRLSDLVLLKRPHLQRFYPIDFSTENLINLNKTVKNAHNLFKEALLLLEESQINIDFTKNITKVNENSELLIKASHEVLRIRQNG